MLSRITSLLELLYFQSHFRAINEAINDLVFLSILDLLLLDNILKNENEFCVF